MAGPAKQRPLQTEEQKLAAQHAQELALLQQKQQEELERTRRRLEEQRRKATTGVNGLQQPTPQASGVFGNGSSTVFTQNAPSTTERSFTVTPSKPAHFTRAIPAGVEEINLMSDEEKETQKKPQHQKQHQQQRTHVAHLQRPARSSSVLPNRPNETLTAKPKGFPIAPNNGDQQRPKSSSARPSTGKPKTVDEIHRELNPEPGTKYAPLVLTDSDSDGETTPTPSLRKGTAIFSTMFKNESGFLRSASHTITRTPKKKSKYRVKDAPGPAKSTSSKTTPRKSAPKTDRKRPLQPDRQTSFSSQQLRSQQNDRSPILRKPSSIRDSIASTVALARQKRDDEYIKNILGNDKIGSSSPEHHSSLDEDVEMQEDPVPGGKKSLIVKLNFTSQRALRGFQVISPRDRPQSVFSAAPTPAPAPKRLQSKLNNDDAPAPRSSQPTEASKNPEPPKTPCPKKGSNTVPEFKPPGLPASARRNKRRVVESVGEDEDYSPDRATPGPEQWNHERLKGITAKATTNPIAHDDMDFDVEESQGVEKMLAPSEPQRLSRKQSGNAVSSPTPGPSRPLFSTPKVNLPCGVRGSMAATPTPSDLGSPSRKRSRNTESLTDDEREYEYHPDRSVSPTPTYMKVMRGKPWKKGPGSVAVNGGEKERDIRTSPLNKRAKANDGSAMPPPMTPPTRVRARAPSTPNAPNPKRHTNLRGQDKPLPPPQLGLPPTDFMSTRNALGAIRQKRQARVRAEERVKEYARKDAVYNTYTEAQHHAEFQDDEAQLQPKKKNAGETIMKSVEGGIRGMSLTPSVFSNAGWRSKGNRARIQSKSVAGTVVGDRSEVRTLDGADSQYDVE